MALVGVQELARQLKPPRSKGTISKHAAAGKIPVADRDKHGAPLFDLAQVQAAYERGINPMMRRQGGEVAPSDDPPDLDEGGELEQPDERRSPSNAPATRDGGGLQKQLVLERQLRNRRLVRQIGEDEGRLVLASVVIDEQTTMARRTRDSVTGFLADKASAAYAFAGTPRTEAEWRVWLGERTREAFNHFASTLALEDDDEFTDEHDEPGDAGESPAPSVS